ncbi:MAG: type II toxin-antitoxin system VapC family toxin [Chloroflexota bacterium]
MTLYYLDSSALAKPYLAERGSAWVSELVSAQNVAISMLSFAEVASALGRRSREGGVSAAQRVEEYRTFIRHALWWSVIPVDQVILEAASQILLEGLAVPMLRTLDAIHLATAQQSFMLARQSGENGAVVVTSDRRMIDVALAASLVVDNPEEHE